MLVTFIHSFIPPLCHGSPVTVFALTPWFRLCPSPLAAVIGYKCPEQCNRPPAGMRRMVTKGLGEERSMIERSPCHHWGGHKCSLLVPQGHRTNIRGDHFFMSWHPGSLHRSQLASDLLVRFPLLPLPTFSSYLCLLPKGELWPKVSVLHLGESRAFWSK